MSNFEALRDRKTIQQTASVPTLAMRNGDFSGQERAVYDPLTRVYTTSAEGVVRAVSATQFANNVIPRSRVNPIAIKLLEFYPEPTVPGDSILRNYLRNVSRPISAEQFNLRIDWTESASSNWFGRYSWGDELWAIPRLSKPSRAVSKQRFSRRCYRIRESSARRKSMKLDLDGITLTTIVSATSPAIRDVASELGIIGLSPANPES